MAIENITVKFNVESNDIKVVTEQIDKLTVSTDKTTKSFDNLSNAGKDIAKNVNLGAATEATAELGKELDNTTGQSKRLTSQMRELKDQLSKLALAGKENTTEFQNIAKQAGEVQLQINKTNNQLQLLGSRTSTVQALSTAVRGLAGGFALAQGATALFGTKNKDLEETLVKVQSTMLILNGLTEVQSVLQEAATIKTALYGGALRVVTAIQTAFGVSASAAWAIATGGISLLIAGVVALIDYFDDLNEKVEFQKKLQEDIRKNAEQDDKFYASLRTIAAEKEIELAKIRKASIEEINALELNLLNRRIADAKEASDNQKDEDGSLFLTYQRLLAQREILQAQFTQAEKEEAEKRNALLLESEKDFTLKRIEASDITKLLPPPDQDPEVLRKKVIEHTIQDLIRETEETNKEANIQKAKDDLKYVESSAQLITSLFNFTSSIRQSELNDLDEKRNRGLITEKQYAKKVAEINRKQALADKEQAIFEITINTAIGIVKSLGNPLLAILAAAVGAAELAAVLAKPIPSIPQFAKGTEKVTGGIKGKDSILASLMPGERIVPTDINEKLRGIKNEDLPSFVNMPQMPIYVSDETLSKYPGISYTVNIDYDLLAKKLGKEIEKLPLNHFTMDEKGFARSIVKAGNKTKSIDDYYSWNG